MISSVTSPVSKKCAPISLACCGARRLSTSANRQAKHTPNVHNASTVTPSVPHMATSMIVESKTELPDTAEGAGVVLGATSDVVGKG